MKNATIRLIFVLALLSAAGIIATQVFWVKRAYDLEEKEVDLKINDVLRNVAFQVSRIHKAQPQVYNIVDRVSPEYYMVQVDGHVPAKLLGHLLQAEFEKRNLITDFQFGIYDCMKDSIAETHYIHMSGSSESFDPIDSFPKLANGNYYFGVYFPHRNSYVAMQLSVWTYSSLGLLCILIFLAYVVFIILKQKRLSEVQKDFVNNMTHEFKTPLTSIQLAAEVLSKPDIINKPQRLLNYATIIDTEATQLAQQVERVLQMTNAHKGALQLRKTKLCLQEIIKEVALKFDSQFQKKNAILRLNLPEDPMYFEADGLHLKNAISNLVDNALKYSGEHPRVEVQLTNMPHEIEIAVVDNGIGIDAEHQKLLFKKFYRVPTGNVHDVKGFGLGLNYVRIIARAHDGEVYCSSKLGKGSKFYMLFSKKSNSSYATTKS
ncbi:MAG TPA: HAMP domain-containing sensor histidine kinase [Edaphocola sp.]|nr:HAMP domain-containing sensor histidine kinase [Edaphocola sp.]